MTLALILVAYVYLMVLNWILLRDEYWEQNGTTLHIITGVCSAVFCQGQVLETCDQYMIVRDFIDAETIEVEIIPK
tara:strand:- start:304 stop:531 length:228 start_codon:yes stop_codon:yes gene_type:complete